MKYKNFKIEKNSGETYNKFHWFINDNGFLRTFRTLKEAKEFINFYLI